MSELQEFLELCIFEQSLQEIETFFLGKKVVQITSFLTSFPNETSLWIAEQGPKLLSDLQAHLAKKMPRSSNLGKIEDHVSKFIEDIIRRDAIGKRNRKGEKTYISQVKAWAVRNAHTQNRDAGVDACSRCMHGALTRREWESPEYSSDSWTTTVIPREVTTLENLEETPTFQDGGGLLELIEQTIKVSVVDSETVSLYMKVLTSFFIEGSKIREISEQLSLENKEVSSIITKVKKTLRQKQEVFADFR